MQQMRLKLLNDLEDVFNMSKAFAQSKAEDVTPKQRQIWIRIMAYTGQVINSISKSFDEAQITKDLERLEKMINEAVATEKSRPTQTTS
jgi:hypothetical protein